MHPRSPLPEDGPPVTGSDLLPSASLVVGVTGHRKDRFSATQIALLEQTLSGLFEEIEECRAAVQRDKPADFQTGPGRTVLVSMLATGADTLGAQAALALGFELQAVLPFPRERYVLDFPAAEDRDELDRLCAASTRLLALSGASGEPDPIAYERGGLALVASTDLIIAIWDGEEARGRGGTAAVVQSALNAGRPVLTIAVEAPDQVGLIWPARIAENAETLRATEAPRLPAPPLLAAVVASVLAPPLDQSSADLRDLLLGGPRRRRWVRIEYPLLLTLIGLRRLRSSDLALPDAERQGRSDLAALSAALGLAVSEPAFPAKLLARTAAADHLANYYARIWRGSFVSRYVFAAGLSVGSGVAGALNPTWRTFLFSIGAALNAFMLLEGWLADRWNWRERWLKYRYLAEKLRHQRIGHLVCVEPIRAGSRSGAAEQWVEWYVRRTARDLGLPTVSYNAAAVASTAAAISVHEFRSQRDYHRAAAVFAWQVDKRLGLFSKICFAGTVVAGIAYGAVALSPYQLSVPLDQISAALFAVLPALGAAVAAVRAQGDFLRLATRSTSVADELQRLIGILACPELDFDRLRCVVERAMSTMDNEAREWKTAAEYKNLQNT